MERGNPPSPPTSSSGPGPARLVLFDIDGTLLNSRGAGRRAIRRTLEAVYGETGPVDGLPFAGKTDLQIFYELLQEAGLSDEEIEARIPEAVRAYPDHLRASLEGVSVGVYPGVRSLLEDLAARPQVEIALLTGNLQSGAWVKLQTAGLDRFFRWGAFGSDAASRDALPAIAVERAFTHTGRWFVGKEVVIVGDTPADVRCGQSLGVRAIAVATGPYSLPDLRVWGPDYAFPDLQDTAAVVRAILAPQEEARHEGHEDVPVARQSGSDGRHSE